tara:strand:- start:416 stop:682 length:267 start_codon:yes stop_codon:yes gene_type:complete
MGQPRTINQMQFRVIALREAPGDRWRLVDENHKPYGDVIEGLVETLSVYMRKTGHKEGYRLEPLKGMLFAIEWLEPEPPRTFDLYGEF